MQQTLRPYVTTGLAIVGAGLVAVPATAAQLPQLQRVAVEQRAVALTAGGDFFAPYTDLFNHTAANLQALNQNSVDMWGLLTHIFSNPQQAISGIPDVVNIFTNPLPTIDAQLLPFPADISVQLPTWLSTMLAGIGPWVTLFNAMQDLMGQIFNFEDPVAALSALFGAPATLLDAFLNGHNTFDVGGFGIPLFNGLLTGAQPLGISIDVGSIVDATGMGDATLTGLLSDAGIGDTPLDTLIIDLLDQLGLGHMTPVDLLNDFGIGTESLSTLLIGLFEEAGIGNPTIAALLTDLGGISPDDSIASLLIALLNSPEIGIGNPTLSELILDLVGGDNQTVGGLIKDLLGAQGHESLAGLVDPSWTVGGLLSDAMGNPPLTEFFEDLGLGSMTVGTALGSMLGEMGDDTLIDLLNNGFLGPDITGSTGLLELLASMFPPGTTFDDFIGDYGSQTLGEMLAAIPAGDDYPGMMMTDIKFTELMSIAGIGDTPLAELAPDQADLINKIGNPTLNALMGTNTVGQTLDNLGLYDATVSQLVQATGLSDFQLETLFTGLGNLTGNVSLEQFFTDLGFNPTLTELMENLLAGMGLTDTTLVSLFEDWGMGSVGLDSLIDALGLDDLNIQSMLNALGLNNIDLDMFIDRLGLSGISIAGLLSDLGMDGRHLDEVINDLLGGVSIGSMLGGLGLDEVYLDSFITDVMTSVLGDPTLGTLLGWLGLDSNDLDTIVANLGLDGVSINSLLTDLGLGGTTIDDLLGGLGLSDLGLLDVNADFYGLIPEWLNDIPQQIAEALGYFG